MSLLNLFRFLRPAPEPPAAFTFLFGERPTHNTTGLRGNKLRFAQGEWEAQLDRFAGVLPDPSVPPTMAGVENGLDIKAYREAESEGELENYTLHQLNHAIRASSKYLGEVPTFYLERKLNGEVVLFARFRRLGVNVPGDALLKHPVIATGTTYYEAQRTDPTFHPPEKHPLVP